MKLRLDKLLVERGLVPSRERAQALILAGKVLVNEQKIEKSGAAVEPDVTLRLLGDDLQYVSRGGLKLERALDHWQIEVKGLACLDVGASTGGFTDCLLQRGAARVIAVDTGYGQMDFRLRQDPRVRLLEKTNARYLTHEALGEFVSFVAMDVSFISATLVLPAVIAAAFPSSDSGETGIPARQERDSGEMGVPARQERDSGEMGVPARQERDTGETGVLARPGTNSKEDKNVVVLVKPQFEAGREQVGKGGIVRDEAAQKAALERVRKCLIQLGAQKTDHIDSPILGAEGNREFLLYAKF
jgi:23S rRNA (cytidine1920-2'-O)/16S rRNA (cytidine1409-2'-O)-methyltransferase